MDEFDSFYYSLKLFRFTTTRFFGHLSKVNFVHFTECKIDVGSWKISLAMR